MTSPFDKRSNGLSDPKRDIVKITPNDAADLPSVAISLYIETGGDLAIVTESGQSRAVKVADFSILPVGVRRVMASGTTASGIHALVN